MREKKLYQYVGAAGLGVFMAQFIYQMHGLFEMHFYAFIACSLLITYANWRLQIPLLLLIVVHHSAFAYLQFAGVEGVFFTQLPYMDLLTFSFHIGFAAVIFVNCGAWGYFIEQQVLQDGRRALEAEDRLQKNLELAESLKRGEYDSELSVAAGDELGLSLVDVRMHLRSSRERENQEKYIQKGIADISSLLSELGAAETADIARALLQTISRHLNASQATFFLVDAESEKQELQLIAGYAFQQRKSFRNRVAPGEGLVGQVAIERTPISIQNIPEDYCAISSSLGDAAPRQVLAWPLLQEQELVGVMEFATFVELGKVEEEFLQEVSPRIASALAIASAQRKTEALLKAAELLKSELQESNGQLEAQADQLRKSEGDLKAQQRRLMDANTELEAQKKELVEQNQKISLAQEALALKAEELEVASKYKSEFLANMSHELRTPLNSILILANVLSENKKAHLDEKEVTHAEVIHKAGTDLLTLINDILDLSKIESGKLDIIMEDFSLQEIEMDMDLMFGQLAQEKGVNFIIDSAAEFAASMNSDRVRLSQILKNLLSKRLEIHRCRWGSTPEDRSCGAGS